VSLRATELLAALPVEGGRWADSAADFQRRDADAVLRADAPKFTFITRPRGGRKTTDTAGYVVAMHLTVAPPGARSYIVASDADQAALVLDSIRGFLLRAPELRKLMSLRRRRVAFLTDDGEEHSSVEVLPADEASAYGLRPFILVADELSVWPETEGAEGVWVAAISAMAKVEGSRLIVCCSAGSPDHWSYRVLEHARSSAEWQVLETPGPLPYMSEAALAEQRSLLTASTYSRLHENTWRASEDRLTTPEQVRACVGHSGRLAPVPGERYVHGLDIGLVNDRTVLTTAHRELRGGAVVVVVDHQEVWQGSKDHPVDLGDVETFCIDALRSYPGRLIADPWQFKAMEQRLRGHGVRVEEFVFSSASTGRLALTLYRLLRDRLLDLPDDEDLTAELASVVLREPQPGTYRIDTRGRGHDDRVISLALCAQYLASKGTGQVSLQVVEGELPAARIGRRSTERGQPPVPVVREGEPRPVEAMLRFRNARRHPGFQRPGRRT